VSRKPASPVMRLAFRVIWGLPGLDARALD